MAEFEPLRGLSSDDNPSTIDRIAAARDFHSSPRRGRSDVDSRRRDGQTPATDTDDEAVLSDVANVSLLEEEGLSVSAIAAELGLPMETVLADIAIAAGISHSGAGST